MIKSAKEATEKITSSSTDGLLAAGYLAALRGPEVKRLVEVVEMQKCFCVTAKGISGPSVQCFRCEAIAAYHKAIGEAGK